MPRSMRLLPPLLALCLVWADRRSERERCHAAVVGRAGQRFRAGDVCGVPSWHRLPCRYTTILAWVHVCMRVVIVVSETRGPFRLSPQTFGSVSWYLGSTRLTACAYVCLAGLV